jgi:N6-L-threonylcarbamoyladenine synthase
LALTVSGGHTSLTLMKDHGQYENIGQTLDDAAGEAFDKVAKLLDLGYPGGPVVSKLAEQFRNYKKQEIRNNHQTNSKPQNQKSKNGQTIQPSNHPTIQLTFPRPILNDGTFNFSFSGLKTAVLQHVLNIKKQNGDTSLQEMSPTEAEKQEICAAFEDAVVDVLVTKTIRAAEKYKPKAIILAGGVAANDKLRKELKLKIVNCKLKIDFLVPPKSLCGDNAAMIGLAAYYHIQKGNISSWDKLKVDSNWEL